VVEIDVLEAGYVRLLQAITDWAKACGSIQAMFVSGSVAEGTADVFSDLDLVMAVDQPDLPALLHEARMVVDNAESLILDYELGSASFD